MMPDVRGRSVAQGKIEAIGSDWFRYWMSWVAVDIGCLGWYPRPAPGFRIGSGTTVLGVIFGLKAG